MAQQRPRGREKYVTGPAKKVEKHGEGLHTGPVGSGGGLGGSGSRLASTRSGGTRPAGGIKLIILLVVLLLGGGGGLSTLLGGQLLQSSGTPGAPGGGMDLSALMSSLGGGSVSSGWRGQANTGRLNTQVDPAARPKRTQLRGGGQDAVTIMVYMCGTDLESRSGMGTADLQEMLAAQFGSDKISLLIYTGGCSSWHSNQISSSTNQIWKIENGQLHCLEKDLGSVSMTDPEVLSGFISYCAGKFPASRYGLIFWDHGGGSISGYGYDEKFASSGSMGLAEIDAALENANVDFDFIGFDACLMATAENTLMLTRHADYLIASEETEPGVGWYYTNWLTELGKNTSIPTIELGKKIADDFVDVCAQKCPGQLTTLSVVDLAELEATVPAPLKQFSRCASQLISSQQYQTLSNARRDAREFAQSSRIDHVDLVHLAQNLDNREGQALADALLEAVKYNRTSSNMTNAYGISIYFPHKKTSSVNQAVAAYREIGMDTEYVRCIQDFASVAQAGQTASGGSASPLYALLGEMASSPASGDALTQLLGSLLSGRSLDVEETARYVTEHRLDAQDLVWTQGEDSCPVLRLPEEQWALVQSLELNLFYDDGEGFIDLGLDNVFDFNDSGELLGTWDGTWLAINGQPVAYYHTSTVDDGTHYTITGRVPVLHNGRRAELLLAFDEETPCGYVSGVRAVYGPEETQTIAKSSAALAEGDTLEFLCDYYGYDGTYQDSYRLGEPLVVTGEPLSIGNVPLEGSARASYRFTDLYQQSWWTPPLS